MTRSLLCCSLFAALLLLTGCMKVSDLADGAAYHLSDAGFLDHSETRRANNFRIQQDSSILIAQGHFVPPGNPYARPNVVAEESFKAFVEYFPLIKRAKAPEGLDEALADAREQGADYVLYTRFASADDRIGNAVEWEDQEAVDRLGVDRGVIQVMLVETATSRLADSATIRNRGGFLTFYNEKPEDLIRAPMRSYAQQLIGYSR